MEKETKNKTTERPPVITVMGHVDHGKSTLLDFIRKTNTVDKEAGGITQHMGAYDMIHKTPKGENKKITFIDTPGHEAFTKIRSRGADVADIVILVVAADDGVNKQTLEALKIIQESKTPFVVAINKIDKPNANIEKTKLDLASNNVYLEGYGGNVPNVLISAKNGEGIDNLLDVILLMAEMEELKKDDNVPAEGFVLESSLDSKKGGMATLLITNGTLKKGGFLSIDCNVTPIRSTEDYLGNKIESVSASSPVRITGFSKIPAVGSSFIYSENKKDAEKKAMCQCAPKCNSNKDSNNYNEYKVVVPVIIKADFQGTVEAIEKEIKKLENEDVKIKIISCGVGNITENDVSLAGCSEGTLLIGFGVKIEKDAFEMGQKLSNPPIIFNIIYEINKMVEDEIVKRTPKIEVEKTIGQAKVLKTFSKQKDRQVIGGVVLSGSIILGKKAKIIRQKNEIGKGEIKEIQVNKIKTKEVLEGSQFGMMIESRTMIAEGDVIESFELTTE